MWRARALVAIVPLLTLVLALQWGAHPEPEAQALPARPAQLVATTTSTTTTSTTVAPTTTTTAPPPTTTPPARVRRAQPVHQVHTASTTGWPCGGDLPPCWVLHRETPQGDPAVWNGGCHAPVGYDGPGPCGSTASGLWQFLRSTWARFRGYVNAADAPPEVQNEKARQLWAGGRGCSHWSAF
jgi:hypothetical protein